MPKYRDVNRVIHRTNLTLKDNKCATFFVAVMRNRFLKFSADCCKLPKYTENIILDIFCPINAAKCL